MKFLPEVKGNTYLTGFINNVLALVLASEYIFYK